MENQNNNEIVNERKTSIENHSNNNNIEDQFASALPEWNLVPPAIVIKRVKRSI